MEKKKSIIDVMRKQLIKENPDLNYEQDLYPIFQGAVYRVVRPKIISGNEEASVLHYLPKGVEVPITDFTTLVRTDLLREHKLELESLLRRLILPFSVNPLVLNGFEVDAKVINMIVESEEVPVYNLEIIGRRKVNTRTNFFESDENNFEKEVLSQVPGSPYMVQID